MPHKHTRRGVVDRKTLDLPPSQIAQPLSVSRTSTSNGIFTSELSATKRNPKKRKRKNELDDTPKEFLRLMAFRDGKRLPQGLDDGIRTAKMPKSAKKDTEAEKEKLLVHEAPTIRPGEKMSEFSARVDAALPVSGLINRRGKDPLGLRVERTKKEKKMHRMYAEWREADARIREKRDARQEEAEEMMDDDGQVKWALDVKIPVGQKGKRKKRKVIGGLDDGEDDPWDAVRRARNEGKRPLNDVVQAPPTFSRVPREKFKGLDDVPRASGSLRKREGLGGERKSVVEGYRAMMRENRERAAVNT
ncbi:hypothetical protein B7494_g7327 [Chlorociboria aeruginascens]|nr:hypothetical protein B7494_g7327 [Chlorociboria aeruginascens]